MGEKGRDAEGSELYRGDRVSFRSKASTGGFYKFGHVVGFTSQQVKILLLENGEPKTTCRFPDQILKCFRCYRQNPLAAELAEVYIKELGGFENMSSCALERGGPKVREMFQEWIAVQMREYVPDGV